MLQLLYQTIAVDTYSKQLFLFWEVSDIELSYHNEVAKQHLNGTDKPSLYYGVEIAVVRLVFFYESIQTVVIFLRQSISC